MGTSNALLYVSLTLQSALESGHEAKTVQVNFNAAFDRVHHQGIHYNQQYYVFCIRSGSPDAPHCAALPVPYVYMCQCRLHAVLWSHIGILMHLLAAEPRSTAGCLTILDTLYSMVWDWRVLRSGPMFFYWPRLLAPFHVFYYFHFLFFLSFGWYWRAGVFGLIG